MKKIFIQLFECNVDMYVKKDVEWIKVVCGLEDFDATYEYICMKAIVDKEIYIKKFLPFVVVVLIIILLWRSF